jgi:hypothetical protein
MKVLVCISLLALLGACGGSNHEAVAVVAPPAPVTPAPLPDAYFSTVSGFAGAAPDNTEPLAVDAIVSTTPEDSEPAPVI